MKTTFFMIFLWFGTVTVLTANAQSSSHEAAPEWAAFRKADDSLQHVYNHVQEEYSSNQDFIRQLKKSQALWKEMRDADMLMRFPKKDENPNFYGSVFSKCYYIIATDYTNHRIDYLNQWLKGIPEGDFCSGSIRFKKD